MTKQFKYEVLELEVFPNGPQIEQEINKRTFYENVRLHTFVPMYKTYMKGGLSTNVTLLIFETEVVLDI